MIKKINSIAYWIETSKKSKYIQSISQIFIAFFAFLYTASASIGIPEIIAIIGFFISWAIVQAFFGILIITADKYQTIILKLNKDSGILYDDRLRLRNVSLRAETLNIILDAIEADALYETGKKVGVSFYKNFEEFENIKSSNIKIDKKLKRWADYDSSSGMGIFKIKQSGLEAQILIVNPFTGKCKSRYDNKKCEFLRGYLEGFLGHLYRHQIIVGCVQTNLSGEECIFKLEP